MADRRPLNFIFCQPDEMRAESLACIQRTEGQDALYDPQDGPRETRNRVDEPGVQTAKADLESAMLDRFMKTPDTVPVGREPRRFPSTPHLDGRPVKGDHALA